MQYIADVLTFMRLALAWIVPSLILDEKWMFALVLFGIAALSDALDGWCARRWPYTAEEEARLPWRHIDHHVLDNGPDALMVLLSVVALVLAIPYWWMLALVIYGVGVAFFGTVMVLVHKGAARAAERVDVVFGYWFVVNVSMVALEMAYRAHVMAWTIGIGLVALAVILPLKWERAVSRPETRAAALRHAK